MASQTGGLVDRSSSAITTSAVQVAAANQGRQYLFVQNLSDVVMYVAFGVVAVAAAAGTVYLAANGGSITFEGNQFVPGDAVSVIAASGSSKVVTVLEG